MRDHAADLVETIIAAVVSILAIWLRVQVHVARSRRQADVDEEWIDRPGPR